MSNLTVVTICDHNYINHFESFLYSFLLYENNPNVHYNHFFIYERELELEKFNKRFSFINKINRIHIKKIKYDKTNEIPKIIYTSQYRFDAVQSLMNSSNNYDKILYLDVDSLINKSFYDICNNINNSLSVFLRPNIGTDRYINTTNIELSKNKGFWNKWKNKNKNRGSVMAGIFLFKKDKNGKYLINKIMEHKKKLYNNTKWFKPLKGKYYYDPWFYDQVILSNLFFSSYINIFVLSSNLFDFKLKSINYIFFSKGNKYPVGRKEWQQIIAKNKVKFNKLKLN